MQSVAPYASWLKYTIDQSLVLVWQVEHCPL